MAISSSLSRRVTVSSGVLPYILKAVKLRSAYSINNIKACLSEEGKAAVVLTAEQIAAKRTAFFERSKIQWASKANISRGITRGRIWILILELQKVYSPTQIQKVYYENMLEKVSRPTSKGLSVGRGFSRGRKFWRSDRDMEKHGWEAFWIFQLGEDRI